MQDLMTLIQNIFLEDGMILILAILLVMTLTASGVLIASRSLKNYFHVI